MAETLQPWLISLSTNHSFWVYLFIVLTACIEGPVLAMIFGVLIKLGYFPFIPIYAALMAGDLFGDSIWYWIGRRYGHSFIRKFGKYVNITEENVGKVSKIFHKYKYRILIISKVTNGLGLSVVTLITAGITRIPFWKYLATNLVGQFVWTGLLIGVGYFFSHLYIQIDSIIGKASIIGMFIVLIFVFIGYRKYLKKKAESLEI